MNADAMTRIGELWVVFEDPSETRQPVESALEMKMVVSRRVVYTRTSMANTMVVSLFSFDIETVKKLLSQYVLSGFRPGGAAKSGSHRVGGVEIWWNWNV